MRHFATGVACLLTAGIAWSESAVGSKSFSFERSSVLMSWSEGWSVDESGRKPRTVEFTAPDANAMRTIITEAPSGVPVTNDVQLQNLASYMAEQIAPDSVEKKLEIQPLKGEAKGYYYCATDPKPKPGEYKYLCQGAILLDEFVFQFTLLYNETGKGESKKVLGALGTMRIAKSA
jgi:hypothetical protein